ncbi:MAG: long-chain fatty acid--CoA ligase [Rhodospirillales bacterium]|nr:long-chain fatty acid--CoA ligase [Rhodospirillales bacterium]
MADARWPNLVTMFFRQADRAGERPLLWFKRDGRYAPLTWREVAVQICMLARGLRSLGVGLGERIVLVSENRPAWFVADFAIMASGAITVPAYATNTESDHLHILEDSGACAVIVSSRKLAQNLLPAVMRCPHIRFIISIDELALGQQPDFKVLTWREVMARGEGDHTNIRAAALALTCAETACIIYTSGTGGAPKGVMLNHGAILANIEGAIDVLSEVDLDDEAFLSILPLSHAYEHTVGQFLPVAIGAEIYYAEGIDRVAANIAEARPTIFSAVPRFFEILQQRITQGVRKQGGVRERLFLSALAYGRRRYLDPQSFGFGARIIDLALERLVRQKLRARFGGRLKAMVSGGAPLNIDVAIFFRAIGLPVVQGYGQTEAAPLISVNRPKRPKLHTVGPPIKGAEVRIAEDGEILVRGNLLMQGYWQNEEASREAIRDGWLHTGDIGEIDADGDLRITDRKKDLIVNSGGDNLSPARIEGLLSLRPEIAQAMIYGDRRPHLVALLVPNPEWARHWAKVQERPDQVEDLVGDASFLQALGAAVGEVNRSLSGIEKIRRFTVTPRPFSIDNGQLTPTLKIRRHTILCEYRSQLDALYDVPVAPKAK